MKRVFILVSLVLCCALVAQAQGECPTIVQEALDFTDDLCSTIERNQACYGNLAIEAVPQADAADFTFEAPGDIVNAADIQTLNLSAMTSPNEWGVALLSLQANLPDTLPGQNVTVLLFGEIKLENAVDPDATDEAAPPTALQAFYFTSGIGGAACAEAPQDGLLIQTPEGAGKVELLINEVRVELGSTAYLQAQPSGNFSLDLLEGSSTVTANDKTVVVLPGTRVIVPLDTDGKAAGEPELTTIPGDAHNGLDGVVGLLPEGIEVTTALSAEEFEAATAVTLPNEGAWTFTVNSSETDCPDMPSLVAPPQPTSITQTGATSFSIMLDSPMEMTSTGGNTFEGNLEGVVPYQMTLISPDELSAIATLDMDDCSITWDITVTRDGD